MLSNYVVCGSNDWTRREHYENNVGQVAIQILCGWEPLFLSGSVLGALPHEYSSPHSHTQSSVCDGRPSSKCEYPPLHMSHILRHSLLGRSYFKTCGRISKMTVQNGRVLSFGLNSSNSTLQKCRLHISVLNLEPLCYGFHIRHPFPRAFLVQTQSIVLDLTD